MTGNILGEPFDKYVSDQIKYRQERHGKGYQSNRTIKDINYLSNRNAWVKLASGVLIQEGTHGSERLKQIDLTTSDENNFKGLNLAKKGVLFNGLSSLDSGETLQNTRAGIKTNLEDGGLDLNSIYSIGGRKYGFQPSPGIQSASIECINRGSIREATVVIKAFNKFQFELIELLYIRLGYSMLLEWGWDKYLDGEGKVKNMGNTLTEGSWFKESGKSQLQMLDDIDKMREKYQGNYDGFFGKVSNFDWKVNSDFTYDITLKLITVGDVIESLKVNIPKTINLKESQQNLVGEKQITPLRNEVSDIDRTIDQVHPRISEIQSHPIVKDREENIINTWLYERIKSWSLYPNQVTTIPDFFEVPTPPEGKKGEIVGYSYYVRLGHFLSELQSLIIPVVDNDSGPQSILDIDNGVTANLINLTDTIFPIDTRICIANLKGIVQSTLYVKDINDKLAPFINEDRTASLMNLYINFDFLSKISSPLTTTKDNKISLFKFLENLCNGINSAFGGYTKLEPVIKDDRVIVIIDQKSIPSILKNIDDNVTQLEIHSYNKTLSNFVKDISFNTKITPSLASQISIGATAGDSTTSIIDGTAFSKWNLGLEDRFAKKITLPSPQSLGNASVNESNVDGEWELIWEANKKTKKIQESTISINFPTSGGDLSSETRSITYDFQTEVYTRLGWKAKYIEIQNRKKQAENDQNQKLFLYLNSWEDWIKEAFGLTPSDKVNILITSPIEGNISNENYKQKTPQYLLFNPEFIERGKSIFEAHIKKLKNEEYKTTKDPSNLIGFIPITLDINVEGISGVKIYQKLNIRQRILPHQYKEAFNFLITKVNHKIENNDWDTMLGTLSTSNIKEAEFINSISPNSPKESSNSITPDTQWSAVFISWLMNRVTEFPKTSYHPDYISEIKKYPNWRVDGKDSIRFTKPGDIIVRDSKYSHSGVHGDIVVDVKGNGDIYAVGGNVNNRVSYFKVTKVWDNILYKGDEYFQIISPPDTYRGGIVNQAKIESNFWRGKNEKMANQDTPIGREVYGRLNEYWSIVNSTLGKE